MKSKTIVCAYGKNEPVERVFERLCAMYTSNYSPSYFYCALIDLPDGISYRTAGDKKIEENTVVLSSTVEPPRLELRMTEPKSAVLPLHHTPIK